MRFFQYNYFGSYINSHGNSWLIKGNQHCGAAKLTYRAFYNKNIKFGAVTDFGCYGNSYPPSNSIMLAIVLINHCTKFHVFIVKCTMDPVLSD